LNIYLAVEPSADPATRGDTYVEVSSSVSNLLALHLRETDWSDGWIDGIPYDSIDADPAEPRLIQFSGLVVWGGDDGGFYPELVPSQFRLNESGDSMPRNVISFRSRRQDRGVIPVTASLVTADRRVSIPNSGETFAQIEVLRERHCRNQIKPIQRLAWLVDPLELPADRRQVLITHLHH
jgi:hypothetical protein